MSRSITRNGGRRRGSHGAGAVSRARELAPRQQRDAHALEVAGRDLRPAGIEARLRPTLDAEPATDEHPARRRRVDHARGRHARQVTGWSGKGQGLFSGIDQRLPLELVQAKVAQSGCVVVTYRT